MHACSSSDAGLIPAVFGFVALTGAQVARDGFLGRDGISDCGRSGEHLRFEA
jgi:hypothetical protein